MHLDVVELRSFYYTTPLGQMVQRMVRAKLRDMWPNIQDMNLVGFGFAAPFLRPFVEEAARTLCLMPAQQGVCPWPPEGPNVTALVEETLWPLPTGFADRLIVAHGLEGCERPAALLEEIWRVLAPGGKAIFLVPNRAGIWARRDVTPFGYGRPYSIGQLEKTLSANKFAAERHTAALYPPPSHLKFWLKVAPAIERVGQRVDAQRLAGVVMVEATKLVYIAPHSGARLKTREPLRVLGGLGAKPATGRSAAREIL
ncbi:MAG TPA: methyltransferase domain-containing protein [Thermohalobaculum sp.]|nr:methyltransferase domain-containing protein [Thermohalobaculum sp.]